MAQNRGSQRGMVKVASTFLLAGFSALLSLAGCSAGQETESENLGTVSQAATVPCGLGNCTDFGPCVKAACVSGQCVYTDAAELTACKTAVAPGVCVTKPRTVHPICCTGCTIQPSKGVYDCVDAPDVNRCGAGGDKCINCDTGDTCTNFYCKGGQCGKDPVLDKDPCTDDSGTCWQGKCCTGCLDKNDACVPGDQPTQCGVSTAKGLVACQSCDDGNVCTGDTCQNGVCAAKVPVAGACDDGNACTVTDTCGNGTCTGTGAPKCDDGNPCTIDACDAKIGCTHTTVEAGTSCDNDANACNGTAKCQGTQCVPIPAVDCDDSNPCTNDSCTPATGKCVYTNNTNPCSDNDVCTLVDQCSGGKCIGSGAPNCNDNEECTTDSCDKVKGCQHVGVADNTPCDDGNDCSTGDVCKSGKCSFVMGKDCNDNDPCTIDTCAANMCTMPHPAAADHTPCVYDKCHYNSECLTGKCDQGTAVNCDDGNPCTADSCDGIAGGNTGCKHVPVDGGDCSDNDACTSADKCSGGKCVGTPVVCKALDACHKVGSCTNGSCNDPRADDGTMCTTKAGDGTCQGGLCDVPENTGGAGGDSATGAAGDGTVTNGGTTGTGGTSVAQGGQGTAGKGGEGNVPTEGGDGTVTTPEGGKSGNGTAGKTTSTGDGGEADVAKRVFSRDPGGCACNLPGSEPPTGLAWLAALALGGVVAGRRRSRSSAVARPS